jgi:Cu-Zn family superoxide dismutase
VAATAPAAGGAKTAKGKIEGKSGSKLTGEVTFTEADGAVKVMVHVMNAPPGKHAVHIHEKGDCSAPDAKSAGGHFNPGGAHKHGAPDAADHHPGDFGNMEVGADGHGTLQLTSKDITVKAGPSSVVGLAIIVHDKEDDMTTQPTGNAGDRIGCGVIQAQ